VISGSPQKNPTSVQTVIRVAKPRAIRSIAITSFARVRSIVAKLEIFLRHDEAPLSWYKKKMLR